MLLNLRTLITLAAAGLLEWLTSAGIVEFDSATLESFIKTGLLLLAALFRVYAGQRLFGKKTSLQIKPK